MTHDTFSSVLSVACKERKSNLSVQDISEEVLGRMVVEAVEEAYDPVADEVAVFHFLVLLYNSTREYEKLAADLMLEKALKASEEGHYSVSVS